MTTWGPSTMEGSVSSGLTGDPRDTTRAREARVSDQGTAGINSSSSINNINNNNTHSRFSSSSSSSNIPSIIMEAVTAMLSPLMATFSPCQLRTGQWWVVSTPGVIRGAQAHCHQIMGSRSMAATAPGSITIPEGGPQTWPAGSTAATSGAPWTASTAPTATPAHSSATTLTFQQVCFVDRKVRLMNHYNIFQGAWMPDDWGPAWRGPQTRTPRVWAPTPARRARGSPSCRSTHQCETGVGTLLICEANTRENSSRSTMQIANAQSIIAFNSI